MLNRNQDIKNAKKGIPIWVISEKMGISENTFYRLLRKELAPEKKKEIFKIIEDIREELKMK